ncbi:MAG TPA: beta-ketoacyl-[acyl-carrier-protein] synthase family protein [Allosphingosinicella sp.]|jgi:nodulation protein E
MNRVAITGIGVVSPIGQDAESFGKAIRAGTCGIEALDVDVPEGIEPSRITMGAQIKGFDSEAHFPADQLPLFDRTTQFAVMAAREALAKSGLSFAGKLGERSAVILGSGFGSAETVDRNFLRLYYQKAKRAHPLTVPRLMMNSPASHISIAYGIKGPSYMISSACSAASHAIGAAFQMVRAGMVDAAVTGGAEAPLTLGGLKAWEALRVTAPDRCRPFSRNRLGLSLGEGAGAIVIENYEHARARGARIYAEIVGASATSDASDMLVPSGDGLCAAMSACLADAGIPAGEFGYVNAHGTGTFANDVAETQAIRSVFGRHADDILVSSTKSMHGHALGATAALELVATIIGLDEGFVPPTVSLDEPDPECDLDYVPDIARERQVEYALSNSFAFGGHNGVLALRRAP